MQNLYAQTNSQAHLNALLFMYAPSELPGRHLFEHLDGGTFGPLGKNGPIGEAVKDMNENLTPFVQFQIIWRNVPEIDVKYFEGKLDLIMLYDLCRGIAIGYVDKKYETKEAPTISTCRWRTVFIRLLKVIIG